MSTNDSDVGEATTGPDGQAPANPAGGAGAAGGAGGAGGAGDAGGADDPEGNPDGGLGVDEWFGVVRGAWPYRALGRDVFDAVIDQVGS